MREYYQLGVRGCYVILIANYSIFQIYCRSYTCCSIAVNIWILKLPGLKYSHLWSVLDNIYNLTKVLLYQIPFFKKKTQTNKRKTIKVRFLAHLNQKFKRAFLITCCPSSIRPSVWTFHIFDLNSSPEPLGQFNQTWYKVSL